MPPFPVLLCYCHSSLPLGPLGWVDKTLREQCSRTPQARFIRVLRSVSLHIPHSISPRRRRDNYLPLPTLSLPPFLPQFTIVTTNFLMMFVIKCHDVEASVTATRPTSSLAATPITVEAKPTVAYYSFFLGWDSTKDSTVL